MRIIAVIPLLFILSGCSIPNQDTSTPEKTLYTKILHAINVQDQNELSDVEYDQVGEYISEGGSRWVMLYPKLKRSPFLGETSFQEGLNIAMAHALSINPSETLQFVDKDNINDICGIPFIEPTDDEIYRYYLQTRTAILTNAAESQLAAKCLLQLDKAMEYSKVMN